MTDQAAGAFDIDLEASILHRSHARRAAPRRIASPPAMRVIFTGRWRRWSRTTPAAAAISKPGDLIGTGTISAPDGVGSMLELTRGGREPATLPSGETRRFLDDGDEVIFRAHARRDGFAQIGFGECRGGSSEPSRLYPPLIPEKAGIEEFSLNLGPRFRGDEWNGPTARIHP